MVVIPQKEVDNSKWFLHNKTSIPVPSGPWMPDQITTTQGLSWAPLGSKLMSYWCLWCVHQKEMPRLEFLRNVSSQQDAQEAPPRIGLISHVFRQLPHLLSRCYCFPAFPPSVSPPGSWLALLRPAFVQAWGDPHGHLTTWLPIGLIGIQLAMAFIL